MGVPCISCGRNGDPLAVCTHCGHDPRPPQVAASIAAAKQRAREAAARAAERRKAEKEARKRGDAA